MKKLTILTLCLLLCVLPSAVRAETITLVADVWCPYNCEPSTAEPGYIIEVARKAFAKHGIEVAYFNVPWSRAIEDTRQGKYNAIIGAIVTDAPDFVFPSIPQGISDSVLYVKKDNPWRYTDFDSLKEISLGVIADYSFGEPLDTYMLENKDNPRYIQQVSGDNALEINVKKLMAGRIGTVIEDSYVMGYFLSQNPDLRDQIIKAGSYSEAKDNVYLAFAPNNPESRHYAEILTQETIAMRESGELAAILQRYGVTDLVTEDALAATDENTAQQEVSGE